MSSSVRYPRQIPRAFAVAGLVWLALSTVSSPSSFGQDQPLGSTATLKQIQNGWRDQPAPSTVPSIPRESDLVTEPAAAPAMKLAYRFWPSELSLRPGRASVHLERALVFYHSGSPTGLVAWAEYQVALGDANPDPADLTKRLERFQQVYVELERFAECEDQSWDLRLRDLRGKDVFGFLLPEVQEYRELARLLRFRVLEQLGRRDFAGAVASIRCGYRLAAFVRQGETLIQQLVGIAIEGIMQEAVEDAIRTPGCPNLYFALATVPHERGPLLRSLEFELSSFERLFPLLKDAEQRNWDRATWQREWARAAADFGGLADFGFESGLSGGQLGLNLLLAAEVAKDARDSRKRLVQSGLAEDKVAAMSPEQAIAVDASRQLRTMSDELLAASLQPYPKARAAVNSVMERLDREANAVGLRNLGTVLGIMLWPAVNATFDAELRNASQHHRLLTIEAVRHFAATRGGQLPKNLAELTDLPAQVDLFTGEPIGYEMKTGPDGESAEFSLQSGKLPEVLRTRRLRWRN
ncbi:MAG: hypothetical protein ACK493_14795 [Planctomycetota bacterium]|jgi:hypothetical protein|nr:hypothetical protein [Blastopirellula sp.]